MSWKNALAKIPLSTAIGRTSVFLIEIFSPRKIFLLGISSCILFVPVSSSAKGEWPRQINPNDSSRYDRSFTTRAEYIQKYLNRSGKSLQRTMIQTPAISTTSDTVLNEVGRWAWGPCMAVDVRGHYAFIGNGFNFQVLDITNPSSPTVAAEYLTEGLISDIHLRGPLAFVCGGMGLLILDVSNPLIPEKVSQLDIGFGVRVVPSDSFAYMLNSSNFLVVDVTNPATPHVRSVISALGEFPYELAVKDGYAFMLNAEANFAWYLFRIDAHNPDSLHYLSSLYLNPSGVCVDDTLLLVSSHLSGGGRGIRVYSLANPASPTILGSVNVGAHFPSEVIGAGGGYGYVALDGDGLDAIDLSDPSNPQVVDSLSVGIVGYTMALSEGILATASYNGLSIVNAVRPDSLIDQSFFIAGGDGPIDIAVQSQYAYVANGNGGLGRRYR